MRPAPLLVFAALLYRAGGVGDEPHAEATFSVPLPMHAELIQQKFGIDPGKLAEKALEKESG